jgi:hypothetical protein
VWFAVGYESAPAGDRHQITFRVYRLDDHHWNLSARLSTQFTSPDPGNPSNSGMFQTIRRPGSSVPDFLALASQGYSAAPVRESTPTSAVYASKTVRGWRLLTFRSRFGSSKELEAEWTAGPDVAGYPAPHTRVWYHDRHGVMAAYRAAADPPCSLSALLRMTKKHISDTHAACAYGWALVVGHYGGRLVVADYQRRHGRWRFDFMLPLHPRVPLWFQGSEPDWIRQRLLKTISSSN